MKKLSVILLIIITILGFTACSYSDSKSKAPYKAEVIYGFEGLKTRKVTERSWIGFSHGGLSRAFFMIPSDWTLTLKDDGDYSITRDGGIIGEISQNIPPLPAKSYNKTMENLTYTYYTKSYAVYEYPDNERCRYQHYFAFNYVVNAVFYRVNLLVDYTELSPDDAGYIYNSAYGDVDNVDAQLRQLNIANGSDKILIVGDRSVESSEIALFLNRFIEASGRNYTAEHVTLDGTSLKDWENIEGLKNVQSGEYCAVFVSGIYSDIDGSGLQALEIACLESDTAICVLAMPNDSGALISELAAYYYPPCLLDWANEIEELISTGIEHGSFFTTADPDLYNELAGYVGARMIYRSLFNETPPEVSAVPGLSIEDIRKQLGSYVSTGNTGYVETDGSRAVYSF